MSLINQVLKDLEQRRADGTEPASITEDLCFKTDLDERRQTSGSRARRLTVLLAIAAVGAGGLALWQFAPVPNELRQPTASAIAHKPPAAAPVEEAADKGDSNRAHEDQQGVQAPAPAPDNMTSTAPASLQATAARETPARQQHPPRPATRETARQTPAQSPPDENAAEDKSKARAANTPEVTSAAQAQPMPVNKSRLPLQPSQRAELAYQKAYRAMQQGNHIAAEARLNEALHADPAHESARTLLAGSFIQNGRWSDAATVLADGLARDASNVGFRQLYARVLMQLGRDQEAVDVLQRRPPGLSAEPEYHALLAALYQRMHRHDEAVALYLQLLKVRPQQGPWWVGLGISLEAVDKRAQAQQAYQRARQAGNLSQALDRYVENRLQALETLELSSE